jgi:hypothetical protein
VENSRGWSLTNLKHPSAPLHRDRTHSDSRCIRGDDSSGWRPAQANAHATRFPINWADARTAPLRTTARARQPNVGSGAPRSRRQSSALPRATSRGLRRHPRPSRHARPQHRHHWPAEGPPLHPPHRPIAIQETGFQLLEIDPTRVLAAPVETCSKEGPPPRAEQYLQVLNPPYELLLFSQRWEDVRTRAHRRLEPQRG